MLFHTHHLIRSIVVQYDGNSKLHHTILCYKFSDSCFFLIFFNNLLLLSNGCHFILSFRLIFTTYKPLWCQCKFLNENHRQNTKFFSHDCTRVTGGGREGEASLCLQPCAGNSFYVSWFCELLKLCKIQNPNKCLSDIFSLRVCIRMEMHFSYAFFYSLWHVYTRLDIEGRGNNSKRRMFPSSFLLYL